MKPIEELGISPTPWSVESYDTTDTHYVIDSIDHEVTLFCKKRRNGKANARFIAAEPWLYEALREAIIDKCHLCESCSGHPDYECENKESQCYVKKWRAALAEASGEDDK